MKKAVLAGGLGGLMLLYGCASNEHLLFFTNSSIGVDISVEQSQNPVKFIVGYKRQEGVLDPIGKGMAFVRYTSAKEPSADIYPIVATKAGYFYSQGVRDEPHSVIAKMNFGATGGGSVGTNAAQWFATGKAAEELAKNPATPAAMAGDAQMLTAQGLNTVIGKQVRANTIYKYAYKQLEDFTTDEGKNDLGALKIKQTVDDLYDGEFLKSIKSYVVDSTNKFSEDDYPNVALGAARAKSFANVADYLTVLETSINNAAKIDSNTVHKTSGTKLTDAERKVIVDNILKYKEKLTILTDQISNNKDVMTMLNYSIFRSK